MKCLLDSHALLWFVADDPHLGDKARSLMEDPANELWFSVTSYWEICIKISLGKLCLMEDWETELDNAMERCGIRWLALKPEHAARLVPLPFHHRDPFDRILIAQAQAEGLTIVSRDGQFAAYPVAVVW